MKNEYPRNRQADLLIFLLYVRLGVKSKSDILSGYGGLPVECGRYDVSGHDAVVTIFPFGSIQGMGILPILLPSSAHCPRSNSLAAYIYANTSFPSSYLNR